MTVPTGTTQTYGVVGRREDLTDDIHNLAPTDTPFTSAIKKGKAKNTYHEWQTDDLAAASGANAVVEGDDPDNDAITATVRLGNYTQLSDKVVQVSSSQRASDNAGRSDELEYQFTKRSKELKRDVEARITGNYASVAGNASTARECAGFEAWIQTNDSRGSGGSNTAFSGGIQAAATDGTQRAFTETQLLAVLQSCWENGGEPTMALMGGFNKRQASSFAGIVDSVRDVGSKAATIVASADVYKSDFGTISLELSRFSRSRSVLVVDPTMWKLCYYQPYTQSPLAKTGHSDRRMLSVEYTLECCNEKSSGTVADLTTS